MSGGSQMLEGVKTNRVAIGARLRVAAKTARGEREIDRMVGNGGAPCLHFIGLLLIALGFGAIPASGASEIVSAPFAPQSGPRGATLFTKLAPQQTGII